MKKYEIVYEDLCKEISARLQKNVNALPTEAEMCRSLSVSRQTLRKALGRLREEHVVTGRQGSGYVLTGILPHRVNQIVILAESDEAYMFPGMISELSRTFDSLHYQVAVIIIGTDTQRERSALLTLIKDPPRGLFAWTQHSALPSPNADLYHQLAALGTSIVFPAGRCPNIMVGRTPVTDQISGGEMLTEHLILDGHSTIGMILLEDDIIGHERYLGYCRAMIRHGLPISDRLIFKVPARRMDRIRHDHANRDLSQIAEELSQSATAVVCQTDELAFSLIRVLENRKIRVPDMISVAGFDNSYLRTAGRISLTTMQPYPQTVIQQAASVMRNMLMPGSAISEKNGWKLIRGGSTSFVFGTPLASDRSFS